MEEQNSYDSVPMQPDMSAYGAAPILPKPQIVVTQVYILPEAPTSAMSLQFGVEARNEGDGATGSFRVRFTLDNGETEFQDWPNMEPGSSHWQEWEHGPLSTGSHVLSVTLDPDGAVVTDTNRHNNHSQKAFTVSEGYHDDVGASSEAADVIAEVTQDMIDYVNDYWNHYRDALGEFTRQMQFPADAEADPESAKGLLAGAEKLLEYGMDVASKAYMTVEVAEPWMALVGAVFEAGKAWAEAQEAAARAQGQIIVRDYISDLMEKIESGSDSMKEAIRDRRVALKDELAKKIKNSKSSTATGHYEGEAAEMTLALKRAAKELKAATPKTGQFLQEFAIHFIQTQDEGKDIEGKIAGTLRITLKMKSNENGIWEIDDLDNKWTLLSTAPEKEKLAGVLKKRVSKGQEVWQLGLECEVEMHLDDDYALITIGNGPLDVLVSNATKDGRVAESIWKTPGVYNKVFGVHDIDA